MHPKIAILERCAELAYRAQDFVLANQLFERIAVFERFAESSEGSLFEKWVDPKTFPHPETKNKVKFKSLPPEEQSKIREQFGKKLEKAKAQLGGKPAQSEAPKQKPEAKTPAQKPAEPAAQKPAKHHGPYAGEKMAPPPAGHQEYKPDPHKIGADGIADTPRVGVPGKVVPPPPPIPRLPNLTETERAIESNFADRFEKNHEEVVNHYLAELQAGRIGDAPNIYATDDAKHLSPDYSPVELTSKIKEISGKIKPLAKKLSEEEKSVKAGNKPTLSEEDKASIKKQIEPLERELEPYDTELKALRSRHNVLLHQTSNAIVKRAFVKQLDELAKLPPGHPKRQILVTSGGVASGKGYAIGEVEQTKKLAGEVGAVWDAAGEQNAAENPWVLEECRKRGLKPSFLYVDSDPSVTWADPNRGVVERAGKKGRMVDARVFADSYAIGSKNFKAFHDQHFGKKDEKGEEYADFIVLSSRSGPPQPLPRGHFPEEALKKDAETIYAEASKTIDDHKTVGQPVRDGATIGRRLWGPAKAGSPAAAAA